MLGNQLLSKYPKFIYDLVNKVNLVHNSS